jgi:hypothetical protein
MILLNVRQFMSNYTSLGWQVAFKGIIQRSIQNDSALENTRIGIGLTSASGGDLKCPDKSYPNAAHLADQLQSHRWRFHQEAPFNSPDQHYAFQ